MVGGSEVTDVGTVMQREAAMTFSPRVRGKIICSRRPWIKDYGNGWMLGADDADRWGFRWGGVEGARFHHNTQNGVQFKTYKLFASGIFYLIFYDLV